ncbi:protein-tyrosine phosphatase 2 [Pyricularia oryzae Y34]|nr:protein-tyrosine phosphatase 2 [Pyricularia oryzae Y34]
MSNPNVKLHCAPSGSPGTVATAPRLPLITPFSDATLHWNKVNKLNGRRFSSSATLLRTDDDCAMPHRRIYPSKNDSLRALLPLTAVAKVANSTPPPRRLTAALPASTRIISPYISVVTLKRALFEMERFSKFRRSKKDASGPTPTAAASTGDDRSTGSASRTPSPHSQNQTLVPQQPAPEQRRKPSPFRGLANLRTSAKRARSSPPASLPQSPSAASVQHHNFHLGSQMAPRSPLSAMHPASELPANRSFSQSRPSIGTDDGCRQRRSGYFDSTAAAASSAPRIPFFLTHSQQEIEQKFQDLTWLERNRLQLSIQNPAPSYQWARVPTSTTVKKLDRYINVQPWHNNRVRLQVPLGKVDYINASPIALSTRVGDEHASRYIAMQGPKKNSAEHVWRMVVEQLRSPAVIVMLTETHEGPAEKCYPYFPRSPEDPPLEIGLSDEFADGFRATVRCEAIEPTSAGDAIELRKFVIRVHRRTTRPTTPQPQENGKSSEGSSVGASVEDEDVIMMSPTKASPAAGLTTQSMFPDTNHERDTATTPGVHSSGGSTTGMEASEPEVDERIVYHFLYTKWPDFGVPALEDLDSFFELMRLSREKNADVDNPRIVHCSAGVGRSGTFIALEHLMRELDSGLLENYDDGRRSRRNGGPPASGMVTATPDNRNNGNLDLSYDDDDDLIFSVVNQLREQRRTMVQAEAQYLFIYQVMRKLWQDKYGVEEDREPAAKRHEGDPFVGQ